MLVTPTLLYSILTIIIVNAIGCKEIENIPQRDMAYESNRCNESLFVSINVGRPFYLDQIFYVIVIMTFIIVLAVELLQYLSGRYMDIDDVSINVCGSAFRYTIYNAMYKIYDKVYRSIKKHA